MATKLPPLVVAVLLFLLLLQPASTASAAAATSSSPQKLRPFESSNLNDDPINALRARVTAAASAATPAALSALSTADRHAATRAAKGDISLPFLLAQQDDARRGSPLAEAAHMLAGVSRGVYYFDHRSPLVGFRDGSTCPIPSCSSSNFNWQWFHNLTVPFPARGRFHMLE